ncbi:hypothetical protein LTR85_005596 [Meristemomyces frigidus]|nr:hypothetical protein LTR85_005596 [Meristemomyces frigidus]
MAAANIPLLSEYPGIDLTTRQSPPNFSKPFGSLRRQDASHFTFGEFRKLERSPALAPSPSVDCRRLRRKPSRADLSAKAFASARSQPPVRSEAPLFGLLTSQNSSSQLHPPLPSTPHDYTSAASPSLTSTASTIQSSPAHTPHPPGGSSFEPWESEESFELVQPVRYKRKFPSIKQAKRLPRRGDSSDWCVYAAVLGGDSGSDDLESGGYGREAGVHAVETKAARELNGGAWAKAAAGAESRRGRSVRFAGIGNESESSGEQTSSSEEKEVADGSTYTLSNFKFPTPPGYNWAGTFGKTSSLRMPARDMLTISAGHLAQPTPPESPATLHYRGASFDVVNPHASLLLGTHDFETPAEIDGLLDDYFHRRASSLMPYDGLTGEMDESLPASSDGSRRTRVLYSDPEDARRNIMRIPGVASQPTMMESVYQESPLARKGQDTGLPMSTADLRNLEEGHGADLHDYGRREDQANRPLTVNRGSSQYPLSVRSDPFDLNVSDDEDDDRQFDYIDQLVAAGRGTEYADNAEYHQTEYNNAEYDNRGGRFAVFDDGAHAEATASQRDRDTTIANIVDAYGYSVVPLTPRGHAHASYVEQSRAVSPIDDVSDGLSAASFVTNPFETGDEYWADVVSARLAALPNLPVPPPPVHLPYYQEGTAIQTSDQTYGATGDLLQITPATRQGGSPSYPWPTGGSSVVTGRYPYPPSGEENKENVPPEDSVLALGAVAGIPAAWSNADLPMHTRDSFRDRGLTGRPFLRHSSRYSHRAEEDDAWEDTQASDTHADLADLADLAGRPSQDSYADLSDDGTDRRLSLIAPQGQPTMRTFTAGDGSPVLRFGNKAHRVLMSGPNEPRQDDSLKRAKQLLKANMMANMLMGALANGLGSVDTEVIDREQHRRNEMELEDIRKRNPAAVKAAVEQVAHESKACLPRPFRPPYDPQNSFEKICQLGLVGGDVPSVTPGRCGILEGGQSPHEEFRRSETMNTMATIRHRGPPIPGLPPAFWSPLPALPQAAMTPRGRATATPSTHRTIGPEEYEEYEMDAITRCGGSRSVISSQRRLLPFRLGASSIRSFNPRRPLTDEELMEREPNWIMSPSNRHTSRLHVDIPINVNAEDARLINRDDVQNATMLREQKIISRRYYAATIWCPVSALMFGLGYFDGKARARSQHGVTEMAKSHKFWALFVATPLGLVAYTIVGVVIVIAIVATHLQ